ncbi:MAG TPA: hypothetical protein RMH99_16345, partial [Sandaracinaceae bacterium LLY-WYZ-13_1]|nr:hypothetical protein [Sandaracinaceae bacterium LLY-WYZ-13_1]
RDAGVDGGPDGGRPDTGPPPDGGPLDPDAACASSTVEAEVERLPVDIVWMVDNSVSMAPAIDQVTAGLNDFATLIGSRDLDYRVIVLSIRGEGVVDLGHGDRYAVCIPPPLSGDASCGDGPRFFQVSVDVRSTQPLEQFLGTLGQTDGYLADDDRGSGPWLDLLRPEATKTIVVVTDDNARMVVRSGGGFAPGPGGGRSGGDPEATAEWFETTTDTSDGSNPFSSRTLPEGILDPRWGGLFDGYTFSALYGWGSETDPDVPCSYPGGGTPPSSGPTYTELVARTGGVRAQICDGASAWGPFFDDVATAVERTSRIDCAIPIPDAPEGEFFQRDRINVFTREDDASTRVGKVPTIGDCDDRGGWAYDDEADPTEVILCPATCEQVQPSEGVTHGVEVQFGCQTIPI